jgi:cytochrome c peroxidase
MLIRLDRSSARPEVTASWTGVESGSRVRASADGKSVAVASLVNRWIRLSREDNLNDDGAAAWTNVDVPFSPGEILWLPDHRHLLVADAFGGRLALIDGSSARLVCVRQIPAHNISALTLGPDGLSVLMTHQTIHHGAQTTFDDIHWGNLLTNVLRRVNVSDVINPTADLLAHTVVIQLGDVGSGAGDPSAVVVRSDGVLVVALGGVNEVAFTVKPELKWKRVAVGTRPLALALTADGQKVVVLNELDDTLSVVALSRGTEVVRTISLVKRPPLLSVDRGEKLFFNARLSHDGWFSCHSCHTGGHSNGQLIDNLTDGTTGTPKRVLSLRGIGETAPYGWDGHLHTLADQVQHSVTSTMQGNSLTDTEASDLVAFLQTLSAWPRPEKTSERVSEGRAVFEREGCIRCHSHSTYTTPETYDVGLPDERGRRLFNPPSLRGIRHGGPYFHHGKADGLSDVLGRFQHQLRQKLSSEDEAKLIEFLNCL